MSAVDSRLQRLRAELDDHARLAVRLGLDLERPLRALDDGYPETTVALIGTLCERLLKQLWRHHAIEGDPSARALNDLIKRCRPHIRSVAVLEALEDIRRLRNRAGHDGGAPIATEDGLTAIRRLVDVLAWFTSTGSAALLGDEPTLVREVAERAEFLAGLYLTLGYRSAKRFVLTSDTVYQLFCRESGARLEYVELLLSRDAEDLHHVLTTTGGELLRTRLPKLTRFVVLDQAHDAVRELLGDGFRIIRYDGFVSTLLDFDAHLPPLPPVERPEPITAAVLAADPRTGQPQIAEEADAAALLARLAGGRANVLVVGRPGSGKSTLLRRLVATEETRRFRFCFDLSLKPPDESFAEYVSRLLAPCMPADRARAYDLFLYLIRSGKALCVLDAVDEGVAEPSAAGFVQLFAELAAVLSAESAVVMSSRVSFLADSPQIRQLLDHGAARSEQLVEQLYVHGVDPERLPHCHVVRLTGPGATPLERRLGGLLHTGPGGQPLGALLGARISQVLAERNRPELEAALPGTLGRAFLEGRTVFSLLDLVRMLGPQAFTGGRPELETCALAPVLRPDGPDRVAFAHTAFQELLAARFLATAAGREIAAALPGGAFLTEQVRAFLAGLPQAREESDDCVLPAGCIW
ncbi:NACHT domain-containing protein [Streptomyces aidingensis]|uniref:NACHT domain-containing protein n=1 Tax=Streptomyces aidingensis TaxID=910347 RepID=A0A1I1IIN7_9ACTN|nr:NACHT domain-containing protein [Streptomyces aidingensis]SFC36055.1 NACHT domain-containing protein [Streptomyces aidingensis]